MRETNAAHDLKDKVLGKGWEVIEKIIVTIQRKYYKFYLTGNLF